MGRLRRFLECFKLGSLLLAEGGCVALGTGVILSRSKPTSDDWRGARNGRKSADLTHEHRGLKQCVRAVHDGYGTAQRQYGQKDHLVRDQ